MQEQVNTKRFRKYLDHQNLVAYYKGYSNEIANI